MKISTTSQQLSFDIPDQPITHDTYGLLPEKVRTKRCTKCKQDKPRSEFGRFTSSVSGNRALYPSCKSCNQAYHKLWVKGIGKKKDIASRRKRYTSDPETRIIQTANQRARKLGVKGQLTVHEWREVKELYGNRCAYCGISSLSLQVEHIWPLSLAKKGLEVSEFATNDVENVVPSCTYCNSAKHNRPFIIMLGWKNGLLS